MCKRWTVAILILLVLVATAAPAHAGGMVAVCDEAHLLAALDGGGAVTFACSGTITLAAEIAIVADTSIDGSGQDVTLSGNHTGRVFQVSPGVRLDLTRLTVADAGGEYLGGGILNRGGLLAVSDCAFIGNSAGRGGGLFNFGGDVIIAGSKFLGNSSATSGGGIANAGGTLAVRNSAFQDNTSANAGIGGGIHNDGTLTVSDCTFSGNSASYGGGGLCNYGGSATVSNSTFTGNTGVYHGGGIYNWAALTVANSTFAGNRTTGSSGVGGGLSNTRYAAATVSNCSFSGNRAAQGGGVFVRSTSSATFENTIVANSLAGGNCAGDTIADGGGNLSYPESTCPGIIADPLLGPLQANGGPTDTMAPEPGSAAIDAGSDSLCAAPPIHNLDQRGVVRPQGQHCDIGAVERVQGPSAVRLNTMSATNELGPSPGVILLSLFVAGLASLVACRRLEPGPDE